MNCFGDLDKDELARAIDGHGKIEFALSCADLSDIDVEVSDRIGFELLLRCLVALDVRQVGDAVPLKAAMQGRSGQMRDRGLQGIKAIIQWQ